MANTILTPTQVTREALRVLHQKLNFVGSIYREHDDTFAKDGAKIGDTVKIRLPNQYKVRSGATLSAQDTTESSVNLQINNQKGVDLNFTSTDLTLSLDDFSKRILEPAMAVLAANIEADAMSMYKDVYQSVWNGGSAAQYNKYLDGRVLLQRSLTPTNDRTASLDPLSMADLVKDTKTLFNDQGAIGKQYKEGFIGRAAGFDFMENTMWGAHSRGAANGAYTTNTTALTVGQNTITVATGSGTAVAGDVFTIAGINSVHPETKVSTGVPQQFTVISHVGSVITFAPAIVADVTSGAQNVVAASTGATQAVTFLGTASTAVGTSLIYQKEAFAFATADLVMPKGVDFAAREVFDGISMRIVRAYDINNDKFPCRLDVLYGYKTIRPQFAARVHNN